MNDTNSRRNFLRYTTLAGFGLSLNPLASLANNQHNLLNESEGSKELTHKQHIVTILQTTDVHCQLHPHDELFWENEKAVFRTAGGYAHLANLFKNIRAKNPDTFIIDTGDMFQGSQLSVETTGKALQPILNAMGYNLYLPGNWEVVYYKEAMQKLLGGLDAPKICANMYHDLGDGKKGELIFPPYYTWSAGGIKIGFVGYTDPLVPIRQSPAYSKGIIYTKPEENLEHYVKVLRDQEQCDFVILLSHLGLSQQIALANDKVCEGVDYIFGGDTHERVRKPIQCKYAKVVEPGAFGTFVGRLDLVVENGKIVDDRYALIEVDATNNKADTQVASVIKANEGPYAAEINKVIGYSAVPLYRYFVVENTIDTLIIDALKWKIKPDIVLSNGFRFCPPRKKKDATGNIPITEGYLYDMLPVDSQVRTVKVTGAQLTEWLEKELNNVFAKDASKRLGGWVVKFKGMKVEFKAFEDMGKRVRKVSINGTPLVADKLYSVCACEREGDAPDMLCRMPNVKDAANTPYTLHQVLKDYLKVNSPVSPLPKGNAIILDAPQTLLTQVTGVDYNFT
ncbi:2',3'-cyclic-nucleotide 2'-phosphodiesterase/5'-or 3'-nucleotidase, 5'-nucleotidase family [Cnuella takakiae]|uniref:2',3'-cyclic-nucleotide 2'-phosphodiesterase/5'-or 3'-nucleotidase, 5'-nucleotidase family n=1 Tax=Cnuella takakiae TaxID=1302690 RepID=A0A1M4SI77_9BACT|nr:bifunctional metallophosphatase/5'-nucleotidase [Cnuella takakiae]OLY94512.1 bifunctional metallophosphatase/5'-nucleotidase [Cnuella takakiae]SHE31697.1 2',3'-cyclic-nucleotide 2'-phosphodiesterase/5'-or 3'-nucleotidase, 5'-nucleotidase family [Cnuella takakiae]